MQGTAHNICCCYVAEAEPITWVDSTPAKLGNQHEAPMNEKAREGKVFQNVYGDCVSPNTNVERTSMAHPVYFFGKSVDVVTELTNQMTDPNSGSLGARKYAQKNKNAYHWRRG